MTGIVIIGTGGHGREILDIVDACRAAGDNIEFLGFVDDGTADDELLTRRGASLLGRTDRIAELDADIVIGVASPRSRRQLDSEVTRLGRSVRSVFHPAASIGTANRLGPGAIFFPGSRLSTNVEAGRHLHVNANATVAHDCVIGDYVTINPGATVSGNVTLGNGVTIGTGANVIQGVTIGEDTTVGAGAVVVRDLPPGVTAVGMPARPLER